MARDYSKMSERDLLEARELVLDRMAAVPQFRRGSLQVGYRKCGKPNCRCARPGEKGHGPRGLWNRTVKGPGGKSSSRGQYIPMDHVDEVRSELSEGEQFEALVDDFVEINEALCRLHVPPPKRGRPRNAGRASDSAGSGGEKGGSNSGVSKKR